MKLKTGMMAAGVAISLPLIIGVYQVWPSTENGGWQLAEKIAPKALMEQVAEENLNPDFEVPLGQMKMLKLSQSGQAAPLYLIDSRIADSDTEENPLCGDLGCAFFGYVPIDDGYQSVLSLYLDPNLPPDMPLIEASETLQNDMPELIIHQFDGNQRLRLRLVLNDRRYEVVETQYLPEQDE
ncbi:hypothetical protein [Leptolyngbya sp. BC1307]|uniref:hypothetical protein n=1 Tax=Leptolyngbya sp. BC1307 TaxID=2029589 RepID=UPI000EFCA662|nr:hypothetical protein [Leptolyngbya sp. BC1307]